MEVLKVKGSSSVDMTGYHEIEHRYPDQVITDRFRVVRKLDSAEDGAGNYYGWYEIDRHYRTVDKSGPVADTAKRAEEAAGIAFVCMAEAGSIDAVTAGEHMDLFAAWAYPVSYTVGQLRQHNGTLYRCIQAHTSQADWTPPEATNLWVRTHDPAEEWPAWSAPAGAHDAYSAGDKVSHQDKHWISDQDGNVWEPGVYGWTEMEVSGGE